MRKDLQLWKVIMVAVILSSLWTITRKTDDRRCSHSAEVILQECAQCAALCKMTLHCVPLCFLPRVHCAPQLSLHSSPFYNEWEDSVMQFCCLSLNMVVPDMDVFVALWNINKKQRWKWCDCLMLKNLSDRVGVDGWFNKAHTFHTGGRCSDSISCHKSTHYLYP